MDKTINTESSYLDNGNSTLTRKAMQNACWTKERNSEKKRNNIKKYKITKIKESNLFIEKTESNIEPILEIQRINEFNHINQNRKENKRNNKKNINKYKIDKIKDSNLFLEKIETEPKIEIQKVNEYDTYGILKFEGEYLNGERNGKGKEYNYDGELKFEGEYLNGKRWNGKGYGNENKVIYELINGKGFIKEYNFSNNTIKIEGEYLNGERNGKGKEYYENGDLEFEGEYLNGKRNGKGKEYYENGDLLFDGEYLNGKKWNGDFLYFK